MVVDRTQEWRPEWSVPPGDILLEALEERGISQSELARRLNRPIKTINEIVKGKASITAESAIQLERALGISARFWINLESQYREGLARQAALREFEKDVSWLSNFPLRAMARHGLVGTQSARPETVDELLGFFGVGTKTAWETQWSAPVASLRSFGHNVSRESLAAWLRWGEIEASRLEVSTFDRSKFRRSLQECRLLTRVEPFGAAVERIASVFAGCGVLLVVIPELPGAPVNGAARWIQRNKPLIQLSLRLKSDDQFWFSLFHEGGHIVQSQRHVDHIDIEDEESQVLDENEEKADQFAREVLVPQEIYEDFVLKSDLTPPSVRRFAKEIGVAPGIVVGRLQRDGFLEHSKLNRLKKPIRWATTLQTEA